MIVNDEQLAQAMEQMGRMYRALAALRQEVLPVNPGRFALMAEGPLAEIRQLQEAIEQYSGQVEAEQLEAEVWLRIQGRNIAADDAPTSILTAFLDAFRKGVQTVAEFLDTGQLTARPTDRLKQACDFRVVALKPGSMRIGIRVPEVAADTPIADTSAEALSRRALGDFLLVAQWASSDAPPEALAQRVENAQMRRVLLQAFKPFIPRPRGQVESVEISGRILPDAQTIRLTAQLSRRVDEAIDRSLTEHVETYTGDLREIDLDNLSFILRNAGEIQEIRCTFEEELLAIAKEALDRRVEVTGTRRETPGRRPHPTLRVARLTILDETDGEQPTA